MSNLICFETVNIHHLGIHVELNHNNFDRYEFYTL